MFTVFPLVLLQKNNENAFLESLKYSSFFKFLAKVREYQFLRESNENDAFNAFTYNMFSLFTELPKIDEIELLFVENQLKNYKKFSYLKKIITIKPFFRNFPKTIKKWNLTEKKLLVWVVFYFLVLQGRPNDSKMVSFFFRCNNNQFFAIE